MVLKIVLMNFFSCPNLWDVFSILLSVFAVVISCFFFMRPKIKGEIYREHDKIKVKLFNSNRFNKIIADIKCEISLSTNRSFDEIVKTLDLEKDWIVCLTKSKNEKRNYIFKQHDVGQNGKTYVRIRFLVSNFIGIKKVYEEIVPLCELEDGNIISRVFSNPRFT